jgi:ABC-type nitrate/sulfonate/bicarbonate transport system permease component
MSAGPTGASVPATRSEKIVSTTVRTLFLVGLAALWYVATNYYSVSPLLLPKPQNVLTELADVLAKGEFWPDLILTLSELAAAFAISMSSGVAIGYLVSRSPTFIKIFEPLLAGVYAIPIILFLPLYVLFFGLGPSSKIALGATISFFPVVLNTIAGFGSVDRLHVTAARSMGANDWQLFRYVLVPAALPVVLTGLRMGFTVALLSIIGSETIASLAGLGHRIVNLAENMDMARTFAYIVFVVVIAAVLNWAVSTLEARGRRH